MNYEKHQRKRQEKRNRKKDRSWHIHIIIIIIKASSSHEQALARAHVGICAGRRMMHRAPHSCLSSVEQDEDWTMYGEVISDVFGHQ